MSELGSLSQCMMDSDADALGKTRRLHCEALVASIFLEVAVLTVLLLWPLITPGVLPPEFVFTPAPPIHGAPASQTERPPAGAHPDHTPPYRAQNLVHQPPIIPPHAAAAPDSKPPSIESQSGPEDLQAGIAAGNNDGAATRIVSPTTVGRSTPPVKRSEGVMQALLIHRVQPEYPSIALGMHLSGAVRLHAVIGTDGSVRQIEVVNGNPIFIPSALAAIRQWRYQPTRLSGEAVEVETYITVEFVLR